MQQCTGRPCPDKTLEVESDLNQLENHVHNCFIMKRIMNVFRIRVCQKQNVRIKMPSSECLHHVGIRILKSEPQTQNVNIRMSELECQNQHIRTTMSECLNHVRIKIQGLACKMSETECQTQSVRLRMSDSECQTQNVRLKVSDSECPDQNVII